MPLSEPDPRPAIFAGPTPDRFLKQELEELRSRLAEAGQQIARLENFLRSVGDGLIVTDHQARILFLNPTAERFLGIRQASFLQPALADCLRDRRLLRRCLRAVEQRESGTCFEIEGEEGTAWSVHVSLLREEEGPAAGTVFLLRDITRERDLDRMKSEFISTAAHELRTPLTTIMGFSELILTEKGLPPEQVREYAGFIHRKAESLARIISDLLDTSRIEAGRGLELAREVWDIGALTREAVLPYRCAGGRHQLEMDLPPEPVPLRVDRGKFGQVLENLLSNAIKYSPAGGQIKIAMRLLKGACQITVEDQGIGMTREQVERAFDRFWRGDSSNTAVGGTGLGLSIAKFIVEAHGGRIWLESRRGKGTTVFFTLPHPMRENESPACGQIGEGSQLPPLDEFSWPECPQEAAGPPRP